MQRVIRARRYVDRRGLSIVLVALVLATALAVIEATIVHLVYTRALRVSYNLGVARRDVDEMRVLMLDEVVAIRGYGSSHDPFFIRAYRPDRFVTAFGRAKTSFERLGVTGAIVPVDDLLTIHDDWDREIAQSVLRSARTGSIYVRRYRSIAILNVFDAAWQRTQDAIDVRAHAAAESDSRLLTVVLAGLAAGSFIIVLPASAAELYRRRANEERAVTERLARAFGAAPLPPLHGLRASAIYVPGSTDVRVGGDWYDATVLPDGRVLLTIGDVAGHGLDAAVSMARLREITLASAIQDDDPGSILARINGRIVESGPLVTMVCAIYDRRTERLEYAIAGHPPPLVRTSAGIQRLSYGGHVLGVDRSATYERGAVDVKPGALVVLYTDGAIEGKHDPVEGEARLSQAMERCGRGGDVARELFAALFRPGDAPGDDVAILALEVVSP